MKGRRRWLPWICSAAWLLAGAQSSAAERPLSVLDRSTGATLQISARPWVLALEQPQLAAHARDYIALYAAEINTAGRRTHVLAAFIWSTVPGRSRFAGDAPRLTLRVQDRDVQLDSAGRKPRDLGISRWPLPSPALGAIFVAYEVDPALLRQLGAVRQVRGRPDSDPTLPPDIWFEVWRSGQSAFAAFAEICLDAR